MTMADQGKSSATRPPELPSDLGEIRTIMAADRTLMAWVRTAFAMLSFSFTIYRFLEGLQVESQLSGRQTPQHVGLFLASMGTLALILGMFEYWSTLKTINKIQQFRLGRPVLLIAIVLSLLGMALISSIAFRLF